MKKHVALPVVFGLALGSVHAQTVPLIINYQGRVTGGTGTPLGSAGTAPNFTAAPENRKVIFRIFDAQTGGTRLWSEQQTVTISLGEFSVLLGQGIDAVFDSATEPRPALDTVFTGGVAVPPAGPVRYLEIVVDDGNGTFTTGVDAPVAPRQRITTTAYSFRSRVADTVSNLGIATTALADGAVTAAKVADNSITALKILDGSVSTTKIPDSAITTLKIADGTVATADLANGAITSAKLDPAIGVWTVNGADVFRPTGRVGIGKVPAVPLDVAGAIAATGNITTNGNLTAAGAVTAGSITTTGPFAATNITANGAMRARGGEPGGGGSNNNGFAFTGNGGDNDSGMFSSADGLLDFYTNSQFRMRIDSGGRVGIGTTAPQAPLDVGLENSLSMSDNGYGNGVHSESGNFWTATGAISSNRRGIEIYGMDGSANVAQPFATAPVGIRSQGWIASAKGVVVYSDRRIKRDLHGSVTEQDLAAIQQLKVTDYRMVDPGGDGMTWRKGFIAQEVEKVIPNAVTRSVEFVPDIFSVATDLEWHAGANTLLLTLHKDHELKVGDRVRLHVDGSRLDLNVGAVPSARAFVVENCDRAPEKVLVYGKQVQDFRTVDYDRIFTTAVGALQELKKEKDAEVETLRQENAGLRDRLAALEASDKARNSKLAAIESLLLSAGKSAPRTVSLQAGE